MASELVAHTLGSAVLGNERAIHLGLQPGATQAVVLLDAEYFLQMPSLGPVFAGDGDRPPTHLVLVSAVDPRTRWLESFCNDSFATFLTGELVPWVRETTDLPAERRQRDRAIREDNTASGLAAALRGYGQGSQPVVWDRLADVSLPVLVVAGSRDETYSEIAARMAAQLPDSTLRIVSDAGHDPLRDRRAETADAISTFLDRLR